MFGFVRYAFGLFGVAILLAGCQTKPPPDPNDPVEVGLMQPDVLMRNIRWASDAANLRVERGEISEGRAKALVSDYARDLTAHIKVFKIVPERAWEYAEVFRTARQWDMARQALEIALEHPAQEDRRVNDSLRLAHVLAEMDQVDEAIARVRTVLNAPPTERAPLLPALTLEIVPAAQGKGRDRELAKLLEDTIPIYDGTEVDAHTDAGAAFVIAKPFHLRRAIRLSQALRGK